jgi:SAM-dependent methyltransferase
MTTCRACKSGNLFMFLPLGDHPPANAFLTAAQRDKPQPVFPLNTQVCLDCALVEVADQLPADFFREYVYIPSAADTMHSHFHALARTFRERFITAPGQRVVDIGCNDGLLLAACKGEGLATLGVEPAKNIAAIARTKGIEVVNEYFTADSARSLREDYGEAQVIVTTNTFNHIDDLHGFMKGVDVLLAPGGTMVIEVPQALTYVEQNEFDTIYHEHLSVFSVASLVALGRFFSLQVVDVEALPIHGGSMRVFLQRRSGGTGETPATQAWLDRERAAGLHKRQTYVDFADRVERIKTDLMTLLVGLKRQGKTLAGYGAPAKGNTLLNYYGIGPELLDFLADRNPLKQGLYSPGMKIPVVPAEQVLKAMPDYLLILPWNFGDEVMQQQEQYRKRGGKFILPIPEPRVVE